VSDKIPKLIYQLLFLLIYGLPLAINIYHREECTAIFSPGNILQIRGEVTGLPMSVPQESGTSPTLHMTILIRLPCPRVVFPFDKSRISF